MKEHFEFEVSPHVASIVVARSPFRAIGPDRLVTIYLWNSKTDGNFNCDLGWSTITLLHAAFVAILDHACMPGRPFKIQFNTVSSHRRHYVASPLQFRHESDGTQEPDCVAAFIGFGDTASDDKSLRLSLGHDDIQQFADALGWIIDQGPQDFE